MHRSTSKSLLALGLMSGTSLDGIDAALLRTDGETLVETGAHLTVAYDDRLRDRLRGVLGGRGDVREVELELTYAHARVVERLLRESGLSPGDVDLLGFHGHTIWHRPREGRTRQLGDGELLARLTGIDVVADFRSADVAAGGEGAPLAPVFHASITAKLPRPVAVLNLGGVANVTSIASDGSLIAFDTGPGNALMDDWAARHTGQRCDVDGRMARRGQVREDLVDTFLRNPYFERCPPKSLDRLDFDFGLIENLPAEDGAATLTAITAAAVAAAERVLDPAPLRWLVTGGGRRNPALMDALGQRLSAPVEPIEVIGWDGDALEAQLFAYLAVRSRFRLPLSFPGTTGVPGPQAGGIFYPVTGT